MYLYNSPEYLQTTFAAMKVGLVPVNTNYRYGDDELGYLWENADAVAVVFHGVVHRPDRADPRPRIPGVKGWLWVDDGSGPCPDWATPYEDAAKTGGRADRALRGDAAATTSTCSTPAAPPGCPRASCGARTTCSPVSSTAACATTTSTAALDGVRAVVEASPGGVTLMPACPLMHGTGSLHRQHDPGRGRPGLPARVTQVRPDRAARHGRAREGQRPRDRGRPVLTPAAGGARRESGEVGLELAHDGDLVGGDVERARQAGAARPSRGMLLVDVFSSSEALGMGASVSGGGAAAKTASFTLGPDVKVLDARTAAARWSPGPTRSACSRWAGATRSATTRTTEKSETDVQGDRRRAVLHPGRLRPGRTPTAPSTCSGRGSVCINSGGEKIFPEEVEEALKTHHAVRDAVVVGIPHPTYGEQIVAVVEPADGDRRAADARPS